MNIRIAKEKDIDRIIILLKQILEIHASIRPDIFISGTSKYTHDEVKEILNDDSNLVYVIVDEKDICIGYAICKIINQTHTNMQANKTLFIDDLCIDETYRGNHLGEMLFEYLKDRAKEINCDDIVLNVWSGNTSAEKFYEKMGLKTRTRTLEYKIHD